MDVLYQSKSASCLAPIDSERASIVMRLITKAGEFLEAGEPQQALQAYLHARDILDGLADGKEDNADLGLTLSLVYRKIGDLMRARGDRRQAKEAYRSSFAIAERLTTFHPGNEELQRNQAEAFGALLTVSDANGFGTTPDCANKGRTGCPILHDASAPASEGSVETPAERLVEGHSRELSLEVRNRTASTDPTGQLIDNVPRKMRVGTLEKIEVRIARRRVADAMTARLWAPDRGLLIEPLSAEICWPRRVQDFPASRA